MNQLPDNAEVQIRIAAKKVKAYANANPMTILLSGIILGLIIGTMIPRAINVKIGGQKEDRLIGR